MTDKLLLFVDGSVNNQLEVGCGAYLVINEQEVSNISQEPIIYVKTFENTSSTKLELQTLLWALDEIEVAGKTVVIFTDSQNSAGLLDRRAALESTDYRSGKNKFLNNHELYRTFFKVTDELDCEFVKVKGHQPSRHKVQEDRLFSLVDRAARKALKALI